MEEEHCFNNWDLEAVVRLACRRRLSPPPPSQVNDPFSSFPPAPPLQLQGPPAAVPELANDRQEADAGWDLRAGGGQGGDELLRALLAGQPTMPPPPLPTLPHPPHQPPQQQQQPVVVAPAEVPAHQARGTAPASAPTRAQPSGRQMPGAVPRSKRRKNQVKKVVCHVPADGSSSDVWAWRKYGQKPIKGSPYPRGYYRCSSSKGCAARKQVERCRTDPNTFILTYTGEHNHAAPTHRNSLAGTTRHKFPSTAAASPLPPSIVVGGSGSSESQSQQHQQQPSPPSTSAGLSPTTPLRTPSMEDDDEEEEDELLVEDMEMAGEDELLFLNGDADSATAAPLEPMSSLFDVVDEPFLGSPWATATTGSPAAAGAAGAGS